MDYVFYISLAIFSCGSCSLIDEKYCKFEYEYKVLERIVELEHDHRDMKNLVTKIQQLEDVNHETAKILESQAEAISQLNDEVKQQNIVDNGTVKLLESQAETIKNLTEKVAQQEADAQSLQARHVSDIAEVKKLTEALQSRQDNDIMEIKKTHESDIGEVRKLALSTGGTGSIYTRLGRNDCPSNGTKLVYAGYIGGSHYTHKGAAAGRLCLPEDPSWDQYDGNMVTGAKLYGGEYQLDQGSPSKSTKYFGRNLYQHDPVCAVCLSSRPNVVMIPGRNKCYPGWTEEYSGYLTAGHYTHEAASQYVCLDKNAQVRENGSPNHNGVLFYMVEAVCGALPCPPYVQGREITCVVCTK